ncbi:hypothetical protein [Billgrantia gudaonensis]|uniref:Uncharacterized protein n=1 Tax=Billgrantia gudaonensis TaxID=376427 RepID=A0A1G9DPR7_9GAMM|nr:hypothetical protein [Halomonas gudaonensis]SDK65877.1 hypothetical protein SAMN04487954_12250 [Halomonas gudaonensis]
MRNKLAIALYFLFSGGAIVMIFALVAGLAFLIVTREEAFTWDLASGSLFFIILAAIFWVCGQVAKHFLTDGNGDGSAAPPDGNASR